MLFRRKGRALCAPRRRPFPYRPCSTGKNSFVILFSKQFTTFRFSDIMFLKAASPRNDPLSEKTCPAGAFASLPPKKADALFCRTCRQSSPPAKNALQPHRYRRAVRLKRLRVPLPEPVVHEKKATYIRFSSPLPEENAAPSQQDSQKSPICSITAV